MEVRTETVTNSGAGRLTIALVGITLVTALVLAFTEPSPLPALGASLLAVGFAAFVGLEAIDVGRPLTALTDAWAEHRRYVGFAAGLFGFGSLLGILLYLVGVDLIDVFLELLSEEFGEEVFEDETGEPAEFELTAGFFIGQNTPPYLISIAGAASLGLLTAAVMVFNGILVGNIAYSVGQLAGFAEIVLLLAPHGIFELTALFIAAGVGFRIVYRLGQRVGGSRDAFVTRRYLYRTGLLVIFGWFLLVLAAFVEAYLTIPIAEALVGDIGEVEDAPLSSALFGYSSQ
ncbi:stage II sporulation protein M [Natrialbaceae archaeon A-CW2]|uniref:stage II sporulation protein M n=1 Tax=Natronosalvus amylolyticus TaxID=2961994 RepID=UPI0020C96CC7|nr:stage II sporulation protein M [Natronosalvus amylolyticus]